MGNPCSGAKPRRLLLSTKVRANMSISKQTQIRIAFSATHFGVFLITAIYIRLTEGVGGWNALLWLVWLPIDIPWSLLIVPMSYGPIATKLIQLSSQSQLIAFLTYPPYVIHGIIGTIWWFFVPKMWQKHARSKL